MARVDHLTHQHRARSPLAAESQPHQRARRQELAVVLRQARERGEGGKPEDGDLQRAHPADAVGEQARQPSAGRGDQQRRGLDGAGLRLGEVPLGDQRRDHQAIELEIHTVERPPPEAGSEGPLFLPRQLPPPGHPPPLTKTERNANFHREAAKGAKSFVSGAEPPRWWPRQQPHKPSRSSRLRGGS